MPNYSTASKVLQAIMASDPVERVRSSNRAKVLAAANCVPPLDEETAEKLGIKINVSWGELLVLLTHASGQLNSAFMGSQYFFNVKLPAAPAEHQSEWEAFITAEINRPLRESVEYFVLHLDRWKCLSLHGVAPMTWPDDDCWLPRFTALSDLRVPTDTTIDFRNLKAFAIRREYTCFELIEAVFNDKPNNHWDKKAIAGILRNYKELNTTEAGSNYDIETDVEKYVEMVKQDGGWYNSDALPTIPLFHFWFEDFDDQGVKGWYMRVVPESGVVRGAPPDDFLWTFDEPLAKSWKEILHCQFGDLSADTPAKYHSVRGLGFILLEPTFYTNLTRCRMLQHVHDNFNILLRITDPAEKARAAVQEFGNLGVVRSGISFIPQNERHQIEPGLVEMAMAQLKQLMGEASASYTQQADNGTQKEQTAFETRVKMEQVNALMGAVLTMAFKFEAGADWEICRRFCLKESRDPDIKKFQSRCRKAGIPQEWLDIEQWEVEPVTPLGMGNPTIAQAAAQQLMGIRPMLPPQAQNEIVHENILTITKDPRKAARWAPLNGKPMESDAKREAVGMFGTLMTGVPVPLASSSLIDQIDALLPLLAGKITQCTKRNNMATLDETVGMMNVASYIGQAIQQLSQDPQSKDKVKQYGDAIGKLNNELKALAQRGQQARMAQQGGENGNGQAELQSKLRSEQVTARAKADATKATAAQKMHLAEIAARAQQRRDDARAHAEIERGNIKTDAEVKNSRLKALASKPKKPAA